MNSTSKLGLLSSCVILAILSASTACADEIIVRGRIQRNVKEPKKPPVPYIRLTLTPRDGGGASKVAYTDAQGMYYFQNTPLGRHVLKVWADDKETDLLFEHEYQVAPKKRGDRYFDISPISIQ